MRSNCCRCSCVESRRIAPPPALAAPLTFIGHATHPRRRAGSPPAGARTAVRPARGPARPAADGEAVASGHRATRPTARASAPPAGDQRGGRSARAAGGVLARRARQPQRGQGLGGGDAQGARGGRPARLRGRAARAQRGRGARQARPVRLARARPLGRAPLCPVPVLSGVGRGERDRDLLLGRRGRRPAVGPAQVPGRHPDRSGRLASVRRLLQARSGRRPGAALHDRRPARPGRGRRATGRAAPRLRPGRRSDQPGRAQAAHERVLAGRESARRRPRRARLGPGGDRPPHARALRGADLRGHGRDRPGRRGGRARRAPCARGRLLLGAAGPPAPAVDGPRRRDLGARAGPAGRARPSRVSCRWRSPTTWPATSGRRSRRPRRPRGSTPTQRAAWTRSPTRWRAPTGSASASRPATGRSRSATTPRSSDLLERVQAAQPRSLSERTAA